MPPAHIQDRSTGVDIALHGLRHTKATALIATGIPVKAVSERLGHSTATVTQDIYARVLPTMQQQAVDLRRGHAEAKSPDDPGSGEAVCPKCVQGGSGRGVFVLRRWRRGRDSNPGYGLLAVQSLSRRPLSTTQPSLRVTAILP